jgi:hypothetical protein
METREPRSPGRTLAVRVTLLAVTAGAVVAAAAAVSGAGMCAAPSVDPVISSGAADNVCYHLVRTLAERVGIATALVTAILALTVVGLSRLVAGQAGSQARGRPR